VARRPLERLEVRRAADPHRLGDGDALGHARTLRDERAAQRELAAAQGAEVVAHPADRAGGRLLHPGDGARESRLAGSVGADDGDQLARLERQVGGLEDRLVADPHAHAARLERRSGRVDGRLAHQTARRSRNRNSGTPITTMNGPTGSSIGALTVRASVSPASSSALPPSAETGST
jgi:hypothetical protein